MTEKTSEKSWQISKHHPHLSLVFDVASHDPVLPADLIIFSCCRNLSDKFLCIKSSTKYQSIEQFATLSDAVLVMSQNSSVDTFCVGFKMFQ